MHTLRLLFKKIYPQLEIIKQNSQIKQKEPQTSTHKTAPMSIATIKSAPRNTTCRKYTDQTKKKFLSKIQNIL